MVLDAFARVFGDLLISSAAALLEEIAVSYPETAAELSSRRRELGRRSFTVVVSRLEAAGSLGADSDSELVRVAFETLLGFGLVRRQAELLGPRLSESEDFPSHALQPVPWASCQIPNASRSAGTSSLPIDVIGPIAAAWITER